MKNYNYFEGIVKLATPIIAVGGLLMGLWKFNLEQKVNDSYECRQTIWYKRLDAYEEIGKSISKIVTSEYESKEYYSSVISYKELMYSKMPLFDDSIPYKMLHFDTKLSDVKEGWSSYEDIEYEAIIMLLDFSSQFNSSWDEIKKSYISK